MRGPSLTGFAAGAAALGLLLMGCGSDTRTTEGTPTASATSSAEQTPQARPGDHQTQGGPA